MRPISLPVDVTNYVMLGLGQPLHAFDLATLEGPVVVRRARAGERLTTLDDVDRALDPGDLLITDRGGERAVAIAGVMGGAETEVGATTRDVLIEAAHFEPVTDRALGPAAQAAQRGLAPLRARRRPGARGGRGPAGRRPPRRARRRSRRPRRHRRRHPGRPGTGDDARRLPVAGSSASSTSRARSSRSCRRSAARVTRDGRPAHGDPADLAARPHHRRGPRRGGRPHPRVRRASPRSCPTPPGGAGLTHAQRVRRLVADVLAGQGLSEVWSAPFVGADRYAALGLDVDAEVARTVRLANPLSDEQPLMRTRLLATMVDALRRNVARGTRDVGLFELGLVVALDGPQGSAPTEDVGIRPSDETLAAIRDAVPPQPRHVGLLLAGDRERAGWWGDGRPADVADVVELARTLGEALGVRARGRRGCRRALPPRPLRPRHAGRRHPRRARRRAAPQGGRRPSGCRRAPWAASSTSTC